MLGSFGASLFETVAWVGWQSCEHSGSWCECGLRVCCSNCFQFIVKKEKRDRDQNVVLSLRDSEQSPENLWTESWLGRPKRENGSAKTVCKLRLKLRQEIGKREILTSLFYEINQEFESQRFQQHQASRWADQAQRDEISLYGDLEMRKRLFQKDHARDCQEIEEEIVAKNRTRARQARIDELSMHQQRNPTTVWVSWWLRFGNYRTKWIPCQTHREFYDPGVREQLWSDPRSRSNLYYCESQNLAALRFWIAAWYTKWYGYNRKRFWTTTCSRRTILHNLQQFKEFGILLSGIDTWYNRNSKEKRVKRKENRWTRQFLHSHFQSRSGMLNNTGGTSFSQWYDGLHRESLFRSWILGKFLTPWNFEAGKSTLEMRFV